MHFFCRNSATAQKQGINQCIAFEFLSIKLFHSLTKCSFITLLDSMKESNLSDYVTDLSLSHFDNASCNVLSRNGLARKSSIPASRQRCLSSDRAFAVRAIMCGCGWRVIDRM